jgi:hypothetical protein
VCVPFVHAVLYSHFWVRQAQTHVTMGWCVNDFSIFNAFVLMYGDKLGIMNHCISDFRH